MHWFRGLGPGQEWLFDRSHLDLVIACHSMSSTLVFCVRFTPHSSTTTHGWGLYVGYPPRAPEKMGLKAVSLLSTDPQVLEVTKQLESVAEEQLGPWSLGKRWEIEEYLPSGNLT